MKPLLKLQTKDGAILTGTDPISFVLEANERELVGHVEGFDLQPLVDRYSAACTDKILRKLIKSCTVYILIIIKSQYVILVKINQIFHIFLIAVNSEIKSALNVCQSSNILN